jgi:hypothetical protein
LYRIGLDHASFEKSLSCLSSLFEGFKHAFLEVFGVELRERFDPETD